MRLIADPQQALGSVPPRLSNHAAHDLPSARQVTGNLTHRRRECVYPHSVIWSTVWAARTSCGTGITETYHRSGRQGGFNKCRSYG